MQTDITPITSGASSLRQRRKSPSLSLRERYVLWASAPLLLTAPWHAGSMLWWSNSLNICLALLPVIAALIPLKANAAEEIPSFTAWEVIGNLLRFPIFWLGLLFLGYIAIQGLNYSWEFVWMENRSGFFMRRLPDGEYISWLPSGMQSPFKMTNAWQSLMMWAAPWLVFCAMWGSFRRHKSWRIVLWFIAVLGAVLAVVSILADFTAPEKIMWIWDRRIRSHPVGPFVYRNQGSIFLYMALASCLALFFHYQRTQKVDSGIQWFALLLGGICLIGSIASFSRSGWLGTGAILLVAVILLAVRLIKRRREGNWWQALIKVGLFFIGVACVSYASTWFQLDRMKTRWDALAKDIRGESVFDRSFTSRQLLAKTTLEMFKDNPVTGWGAGSFRFYFPVYQQEHIELQHPINRWGNPIKSVRYFWRHAHSDWAQFLAEYGIIGSSFLLLGLFYLWGSILLRLTSLHCEHLMLLAATVLMVCHASLDIVFYNPSLLIVFSAVLVSTAGLARSRSKIILPAATLADATDESPHAA